MLIHLCGCSHPPALLPRAAVSNNSSRGKRCSFISVGVLTYPLLSPACYHKRTFKLKRWIKHHLPDVHFHSVSRWQDPCRRLWTPVHTLQQCKGLWTPVYTPKHSTAASLCETAERQRPLVEFVQQWSMEKHAGLFLRLHLKYEGYGYGDTCTPKIVRETVACEDWNRNIPSFKKYFNRLPFVPSHFTEIKTTWIKRAVKPGRTAHKFKVQLFTN